MPRLALEGTSRPGLLGELMRRLLCQRLAEEPRALPFLSLAMLVLQKARSPRVVAAGFAFAHLFLANG